jgi:hypothetical protein
MKSGDMKVGGAYVVTGEVVDVGLGEHGVVLELRLAERWGVASNDDKLGLSGAESLEGRLVSEGDCRELLSAWSFCCPFEDVSRSSKW